MIKPVLRFFILCVIFTIIVAFLVFYVNTKIDNENDLGNFRLLTKSVFASLDSFLAPYPIDQWETKMNLFRPEGSAMVTLIPISQLSLTAQQFAKLNHGEEIYVTNVQNAYEMVVGYRRAGQSSYAYKTIISSAIFWMKYFFGWPIQILTEKLHQLPEALRADYLKKESQHFGYPLALVNIRAEKLALSQKNRLLQHQWVIDFPSHDPDVLQTFYVPFEKNSALKFGPLELPLVGVYRKYILFVLSLIAVELVVFILAILFARTLERLKKLADEYGRSNFDANVKISKTSTLYPLFNNLRVMGQRIKTLLNSHKELTNTVSHELRTPISRLRFSLELVKSAQTQEEILMRVETMEEDVAELEDLVSEILTYAQLDRMDARVEMKDVSVIKVLNTAINKLPIKPDKKVINTLTQQGDSNLKMNERYILRALQNILQNAVKHARSIVKVSMPGAQEISIEDDGAGIPVEERENIFNPFVQLTQQPKDEKKGYGLGLAIARKILMQHGWEIFVTDSELGGAKILIRF